MTAYRASYGLNKIGQNYDALSEELKKSLGWCYPLNSTWLISTNEAANQLTQSSS